MSRNSRPLLITFLIVLLFSAAVTIRAVSEPSNNFHFSIVGDRTGDAQPQIYGRIWQEIDLLHPDFVINVGDSIQGRDDETAPAQWRELQSIWKRYKHYPLYLTPGNHDIWSRFSEKLYVKETGYKPYYSFNYQDAHFTVLDNSRTSGLSDEQMKFLEEDLKANEGHSPKFIFFHRPFWIEALQQHGTGFPLQELAKKYGVQYIISGHGHQFVRRVSDGIVYMEVGSSGGTMRGKLLRGEGFADGCFYHFVWGHVEGSKVSFTVKELDGPAGQGRMFSADEWDENGPHFDTGDPAITSKPPS